MIRTGAFIVAGLMIAAGHVDAADKASEWKTIFGGDSMKGWKASENKDSWQLEDGNLVCKGPRSHLFYVGDDKPFTNFEFEGEVKTQPGSNAGIYFHTKYQETGWPKFGYECQVNITHKDPKKTGSLYGVVNIDADKLKGLVKDDEWYKTYIKVDGRHIVIKVNGETMVDYMEPEGKEAFSKDFERRLGAGTIALQAHDPDSVVAFRNLKIRRMP